MPPKSSKKDEPKLSWVDCEKCGYKITRNQLKSKDECTGLGINGNKFYTKNISNHLPADLDLKDTTQMYLFEKFLFVPESICNYCNFTMNCNLLVVIDGCKKYVKNCFTIINDKFIDKIYSNSKELYIEQDSCVSVTIKRFQESIKIAQKITLKSNESIQDNIKEIERLVRAKIRNTLIHPTNIITIDYLNKRFTFTVDSFEEQTESDILEKFSHLNLNDDCFYLIEARTTVEICTSSFEDSVEFNALPKISVDDIGGVDEIIKELKRTMQSALDPQIDGFVHKTTRCALIYGLSGCGKSMICEGISNTFDDAKIIRVEPWKIFSKFYGESESNLRKIFEEAFQIYPRPCIILVDEISNICPKNDNSDVVRKVSGLFVSLLDSLQKRNGSKIFVLATTNNLDNLDTAIRRSGRMDYEIEIPIPNNEMRIEIFAKFVKNFSFSSEQIQNLAKFTHGFVGADIAKLIGMSKIIENSNVLLSYDVILSNISSVKPSAMRELLIEKPNIKWTDIGGMNELKLKLKQIVEWPLQHPETFKRLGIKPPRGLLMFGPPGCSKTMIAKALASESNLNFISIKGSDLFSMWVGESEKAVRDLFIKARQLAPCIIFFDEIDAIGGERESGSSVKERVLAQILTEIDGVNVLKNVIIVAATNRPDLIDKALMRPGRLDRIIYVKLPDTETRHEIFKIKLQNIPVADDISIEVLVNKTEGYSGAEIEAVCKEAALSALEESFDIQKISMKFFDKALEIIKPRTSTELLKIYDEYQKIK